MSSVDRPLLVVDAANVVGSVPDGWWRDRAGATERLREALRPLAAQGLPGAALAGPLEVGLVVEGAAARVPGVPDVTVAPAAGSGDDEIVRIVAAERERAPNRHCVVVTADRALRELVRALGADVVGPRTVRPPVGRPTGRDRMG